MHRDVFSSYNPITNFIFFMGAIILGMIFLHPVFVACLLVAGLIYYFYMKRRKGLKMLGFVAILFAAVSLINPLFNTQGRQVLFRVFGRPYTLEALIYGTVLAGMIAAVFIWFACFNSVMTNDKFVFLFGRMAPSVSLILSMVFRLIPDFQRKAKQIAAARSAIGMAGSFSESKKEKIRNGTVILGTLTAWTLENGIISADSMRARGYGTGRRTSFTIYRFRASDRIYLILTIIFIAFVILCAAMGATACEYTPDLNIAWFDGACGAWVLWGSIAYTVFLLMPTIINVRNDIGWKIRRSRI